jgi:hypothetical protein
MLYLCYRAITRGLQGWQLNYRMKGNLVTSEPFLIYVVCISAFDELVFPE